MIDSCGMPRKRLKDMLAAWSSLIFICALIFTSIFTPQTILHPGLIGTLDKTSLEGCNTTDDRNPVTGTRAYNPYIGDAIYPYKTENSDGDSLDYLNLDEDAPGDGFYEISGDTGEPNADWIEVTFPSAGIPVGSKINNIIYYYGYYTNDDWGLTTDVISNMTWRVGATENDMGNYTLSSPADTDIDSILIQTVNLPSAENLNSGNFTVRFRGVDGGAPPADNFYLDYCYFTIDYSIPNIVINEVMFNPIGGPYDDDWQYRKIITINASQVVSELNDFPVLINIIDSDLQSKARLDGYDILFTASDGEVKLDHEIEGYNSTSGQLVAWVRIPTLSNITDTVIYMYYGNPNSGNQQKAMGVWDGNFTGVWHLKETPSGAIWEIKDSTSNDNNGTTEGFMDSADSVDTKIGKGLDFDEIDDLIRINDSASLDSVNEEATIQLWIYWDNASDGDHQIVMTSSNRFSGPNDGFEWASQGDGDHFFYPWGGNNDNYNLGLNPFTNQTWHHLVVTLDNSSEEVKVYVDSVEMLFTYVGVPGNWTQLASIDDWLWGGNPDRPTRHFDGMFDEIRVSDVVRSIDWIKTEYNNQNSTSSFYFISNEEIITNDWPYRKSITIDSNYVTGDQTDFPILVKITDSDLQSRARPDGYDIKFTTSDGMTKLDHEIESYNSSTGELVAWVRIPSLSSTSDNIIFMYYGNPNAADQSNASGVWINNYSAVWHLKEDPMDPPPQFNDSSPNDNRGVANSSMTSDDQVASKFDGGIDFDGIDDKINIPASSTLNFEDNITFSGWFKLNSTHNSSSSTSKLILEKHIDGNYNMAIVLAGTDYDEGSGGLSQGALVFKINSQNPGDVYTYRWTSQTSWDADTWYYFVCIHNGTDNTFNKIYINGVEDIGGQRDNALSCNLTFNADWNIGGGNVDPMNIPSGQAYFDGIIDEVRISGVMRSMDWIVTEYNNQNSTNVFYSIGNEEIVGYDWVELYNAETYAVDLTGWSLTDKEGNIFDLSGAGSIPAGGYLVCHIGQPGINSSTDIHGAIINEIILQPNATAGKDNYLSDMTFNSNYGGSSIIDMENGSNDRRIIMQFNISNIPTTNIVDSHIWLYKYDGPLDNDSVTNVHRVTSPWTELGSDWDTYDGTNDWPINDDGGDFDPSIEDTTTSLKGINGWYSWDITNLTRAWKNGTYQNYGMIFVANWNSKLHRFRSSDYTTNTSLIPKLIVYYWNTTIKNMLEDNDDLALLDNDGHIIDYIAWGSDPGTGDDNAVLIGQWDDCDYINTTFHLDGNTLGRDKDSNDADQPEDWQNATGYADPFGVDRSNAYGPSPGEANVDPASIGPAISNVVNFPETQEYGGYVNITCDAADVAGVNGVWVNISLPGGGYSNTSMIQGTGTQWYFNNSYSILGIYNYVIWANNTNGNLSSSSGHNFTIMDTTLPEISNVLDFPDPQYAGGYVNITSDVTDNVDVDGVWVNITLPGGGYTNISMIQDIGNQWYFNTTYTELGVYSYTIWVNDTSNNWNNSGILQFEVLNRDPMLSLDQVNPNTGFADTWFNFTVSYTDIDDHAPDIITVNITNLGIFDMIETDPSDTDYRDGKEYYYNVSGFHYGTSYSFHFAANDSFGGWASETPEIIAPDIIQKPGALDALDYMGEFSDEIYLNATLFDNDNNPISGEDVAFYIDMNKNGSYEIGELVGNGITLGDGTISLTYTANLAPGEYNFTAEYTGSGDYVVTNDEALLTINAKQASLTSMSDAVDEGVMISLNATIIDDDGDPIANEQVEFYIDTNKNGIYDPSEFIGSSTTSASGAASITYTVSLTPDNYGIWAKYEGSANYTVTEIEGLLTVQGISNNPPTILGTIPDQLKTEDCLPWSLNLSGYGSDFEDPDSELKWFITGENMSLYTIVGENTSNILTFVPRHNAYGNDEITLWLEDTNGALDSQKLWINITPVNDQPYFDPFPPNLIMHYYDPDISEGDPYTWNYTAYVHDVETKPMDLIFGTSEPASDLGNGYISVDGLEAAFYYPYSRLDDLIPVTLTISDGEKEANSIITILVSSNWAPRLVDNLPDITLEENSTLYYAFDLDDYFWDRDNDTLFFATGYSNLEIVINENHTVDFIAPENWFGTEYVTFRAYDPTGAIIEETIIVTVTPVNDPPIIAGVPDIQVHYNHTYSFDLSPYIFDGDNGTNDLTIRTSEPQSNIWVSSTNNLLLMFNYPVSRNGEDILVTIWVSDGINENFQEIMVGVTDNYPPSIMWRLPDISFKEDEFLNDTFDLDHYFLDVDDNILFFTYGYSNIFINIMENHTVDFSASPDWNGFEMVTFRATDPSGAIVEDTILVNVIPVNDAPRLSEIPHQYANESDTWVLDLSEYISDIDNEQNELIITVHSDAGEQWVNVSGFFLILQYPAGVEQDTITITVSDGVLNASQTFSVTISIVKLKTPNWYDNLGVWILLIAFVIIILGLVCYRLINSRFIVHEIFLIHKTGLFITHSTSEATGKVDDVKESGMLLAGMGLIRDSFASEDELPMPKKLKVMGKYLIAEKGENIFALVVHTGDMKKRNLAEIKNVIGDIEEHYGEVLDDWIGDTESIEGIEDFLNTLLKPSTEN